MHQIHRALLFDFDGLIVDSETPEFVGWQEIFRAHGAELTETDWRAAVGYINGFDPRAHLENLVGHNAFNWPELEAARRLRNAEIMRGQPVLPGIAELMRAGVASGWRIGVASSSTRDWVEGGLDRLGLRELVETICTRDSPGVRAPKPAPDVYNLALRELGADADPSQSFAFEDSQPGVQAAKAAGLRVIAVPNALTQHQDLSVADAMLASMLDFKLPVTR